MNYLGIDFKWELKDKEKKFIKYLIDNDFIISNVKQYITKIKFNLRKDDISMDYEMSSEVVDVKNFIKMFNRSWELTKKIKEME